MKEKNYLKNIVMVQKRCGKNRDLDKNGIKQLIIEHKSKKKNVI